MTREVWIVGGARTAIGGYGGSLKDMPATALAAHVTREALARARVIEPHWSSLFASLGTRMAYMYARGGDHAETAYRARAYAPLDGIPEDPATGSATAILAAQLLAAETLADGTHRWRLEQGYEMGRPSDLWLEADVAAAKLVAVRVAGQAVQIMSGVLDI